METFKQILVASTPFLATAAITGLGGCNKADTPTPPAPAAQNSPPATLPTSQPAKAPVVSAPATQWRDPGPIQLAGERP